MTDGGTGGPGRVDALLEALTPAEKASLTAGADLWTVPAVPRLGLPALAVTDGPNGARGTTLPGETAEPTTCVPCGSALGATWDPGLVAEVGALLGAEARAKGCRVLLAPTVNIPRSPLAGRNFECYSEDPLLSGRLAAAFVRAVQGEGVATTVKHLVANDAEFERNTMSSTVDERTLREIYLVPFELAVREGGSLGLMTGYNRLNGRWCSEDGELLGAVVRDEWGFEGFVVTDWYAVASTDGSAAAGVDLEMPGPGRAFGPALAHAVEQGAVPAATLDAQVRRQLTVRERIGELDDRPGSVPPRPPADRRAAVARAAAIASTVLLSNDGLLPLGADPGRVAVVGANAAAPTIMGGGSSSVRPDQVPTIVEAIAAALDDTAEVIHEPGVDLTRSARPLPAVFAAEFFRGFEGDGPVVHECDLDAEFLFVGPPDPAVRGPFSLRARTTFRPDVSGPHELTLTQVGRARLLVDGRVVLDGTAPSGGPGRSFMGLGTPEIAATVDLDAAAGAELTLEYDSGGTRGVYAARVGLRPLAPPDLLERAVSAATGADVAVVVVGTTSEWESEGFDRDGLSLPGGQDELVARVIAANPRTVVVVNTGAPVAMPWADDAAAVVQAWFGGQQMGPALAAVLTGEEEPGGRLAVSFPERLEHTPAFGNFPGPVGGRRDEVVYGEGLLVGYRWYETRHLPTRFAFGHGLGYTVMELGEPTLSASRFGPGDELHVRVPVANLGPRRGAEVVQCYVEPPPGPAFRPARELKAFAKVHLDAGATGTVDLVLDDRAFAFWDPGAAGSAALRARMPISALSPPDPDPPPPGWRIAPGRYRLHVGRSSVDTAHTLAVDVDA